jgi:palmitoyltransferase
VLAALFSLFTGGLHIAHLRLILFNISTLEEMTMSRMRQRENAKLTRAFGHFGFLQARRVRKRWDWEWGNPQTEGNVWWLGSARANWEMVMGRHKLPWFCTFLFAYLSANGRR